MDAEEPEKRTMTSDWLSEMQIKLNGEWESELSWWVYGRDERCHADMMAQMKRIVPHASLSTSNSAHMH